MRTVIRRVRSRLKKKKIICFVLILSIIVLAITPESIKASFVRVLGREIKGTHFQINEVNGDRLAYYNMTFVAQRAFERKTRIKKQCEGRKKELFGLSSEKSAYKRIEINREYPTLYCPVMKVASTFWRRIFHAMRNHLTIDTPYDVGIDDALTSPRERLSESLPWNNNSYRGYLQNSLNIIFVRDPFSRLMSAYVDKLFAPNPHFWNLIGKVIIKNYRKDPSPLSLQCGHDVTFPEFLKYVIDTEEHNKPKREPHFIPTYDLCKPCEIPYNAIGKMETFKEDTAYILHSLGYEISQASLTKWAAEAEKDAIWDSTTSPFSWRNDIIQCMHFHEAAKRIWHKMQIRGIVRKDIDMPFRENEIGRVSPERFMRALMGSRGSDRQFLKEQKNEVLRKAYAHVPSGHVQKIRKLFKPDFELFGYDMHPKHIFLDIKTTVSDDDWLFNVN